MKFLDKVLFFLSIVSLIVFLSTSSVRLLTTNYFLRYEFKKLDISEKESWSTGDKLLKFLSTSISYKDTGIRLFGKKEILHLYDVKGVFKKTFLVQKISGVYLIFYLLLILLLDRFNKKKMLKSFFIGGLILIFLIVGLFIFSFFGFDEFFTQFHQIFFAANSWIFSSSDKLIQLFPEAFWFDALMGFVLLTLIESILMVFIYLYIKRYLSENRRYFDRQKLR